MDNVNIPPLKFKPILKSVVWGGEKIAPFKGIVTEQEKIGESWEISGVNGNESVVLNGPDAGLTLSQMIEKYGADLVGHKVYNSFGTTFPLLIKIIDAKDDLSIQVHPNDEYARVHENGALGKTECWYVLDCDEGATIIIGHNAATHKEMREMVEQERWTDLLREVPIRKGDFFQIDPGCLHAIKGGTLILETQQSSDVTYRFYDYGRLENGKPRTLHIEQSLAVTQAPFQPHPIRRETAQEGGAQVTKLVECPYYTVYHAQVDGLWEKDWEQPFVNVSVIGGEGVLDGEAVRKGDHLLLPAGYGRMRLEGKLELMLSHL